MATLSAPAVVEATTAAALEEKSKLKRHFGRFDIFFFLICTIVGVDTIGTVAAGGGQNFVWLLFLSVAFFVPYALLTAELGSAFREEGGSYIWTKLALGRPIAGVNSVLYWLSNPIWLGGTLTTLALTTFKEFFWSSLGDVGSYVFAIVFIWFATWAAILSFGVGKWIPTIGAWSRILLIGAFTFTVAIYAAKNGIHGVAGDDFVPTWAGFIATVPVLFFNFVGFELPNAAGDEMKDAQKDVPYTVKRAAAVSVLAYGLPVLSILLVVPKDRLTSLGGFIDAIKQVFTVYGGSVAGDGTVTLTGAGLVLGNLAAAGFIWTLLSSGTTWIMGADRAQAVAAFDGAGPRWLGVFSRRWGTPIAVNLASGVFATVMFVLAYSLTSGNASKLFGAVLGLAISTTTISYLSIFPALYILRRKLPQVPRPYRIPGGDGVALFVSVLCTGWAALASVSLLWPGFLTTAAIFPVDDGLPDDWAGQRMQYELSQLLPLAVFLLIGVVFYALGAATRRQQVEVTLNEDVEHLVPLQHGPAGGERTIDLTALEQERRPRP